MNKRFLGCSIPVLALLLIFFLALSIFGLIIGPVGSILATLLGFNIPEIAKLAKPHVELPSEGIAHISGFTITNTLIASWLTIIVLALVFYYATLKMKLIPDRLQNFTELIIEVLLNFISSSTGEKNSRKLFPMVATIFLYVATNAYLALIPIFGTIGFTEGNGVFIPILRAANTDINLPLSIAIVSFLFIEFLGFRSHGFFRYINSFFQFGKLREGFANLLKGKIKPAFSGLAFGALNLIIGVLEVISHLIRLLSFTFRLFGNMTAGEILLLVITFLFPFIATIFVYGLELLVGILQALIFAGLTMVFATMALTSHDEEPEHKT